MPKQDNKTVSGGTFAKPSPLSLEQRNQRKNKREKKLVGGVSKNESKTTGDSGGNVNKKLAKGNKQRPKKMNLRKQIEEGKEVENVEEESSEFSFEESSDVSSNVDSSDLSSSATDEFGAQVPQIRLDPSTQSKIHEKIRQKKLKEPQIDPNRPKGAIFVGNICYGFYEDQMRGFFSQFGNVTRLRLSRHKKTGKPRRYAFVEFEDESVAKIVADTMDGYIMYRTSLVCKFMPPETIHENLWKGANQQFVPIPHKSIFRKKINKERTPEEIERNRNNLLKKEEKKRDKFKALGIDYDFPGYAADVKFTDTSQNSETLPDSEESHKET